MFVLCPAHEATSCDHIAQRDDALKNYRRSRLQLNLYRIKHNKVMATKPPSKGTSATEQDVLPLNLTSEVQEDTAKVADPKQQLVANTANPAVADPKPKQQLVNTANPAASSSHDVASKDRGSAAFDVEKAPTQKERSKLQTRESWERKSAQEEAAKTAVKKAAKKAEKEADKQKQQLEKQRKDSEYGYVCSVDLIDCSEDQLTEEQRHKRMLALGVSYKCSITSNHPTFRPMSDVVDWVNVMPHRLRQFPKPTARYGMVL